jgi:hypothetical protein
VKATGGSAGGKLLEDQGNNGTKLLVNKRKSQALDRLDDAKIEDDNDDYVNLMT